MKILPALLRLVRTRSPLVTLIVVGLLCRVAFVWFTPTFYAPDEQSHYHYIQYLAEHHALPVLNSKLGDASNEWEYSQPPFYYALLVPAFQAAQAAIHNPATTVLLLRTFSVLLWLLNVWFGVVLLRRMQIVEETTRVLVFGLVCLLPTYTFVSAARCFALWRNASPLGKTPSPSGWFWDWHC